jgi:hypothetical protein
MNERIRELAAQADEYATEKARDGFSNYNLVYDRKFAELIVKACADAADMAQDARCEYAGDYVAEQMGFGQEHGVAKWRAE